VGENGEKVGALIGQLRWLSDMGIETVIGVVPNVDRIEPLEIIGRKIVPAVADFQVLRCQGYRSGWNLSDGRPRWLLLPPNPALPRRRTYTQRSRSEKDKWSNRLYGPVRKPYRKDKTAVFAGNS